jgi:hypothetical protein
MKNKYFLLIVVLLMTIGLQAQTIKKSLEFPSQESKKSKRVKTNK